VASIERHLRPSLGAIPLATVSRQDVRRMLAIVEQRGPIIAAAMLRRTAAIFKWAMARDFAERDPTFGIPRDDFPVSAPRQRLLSDSELAAIWRAGLELGYPSGDLVRFMILSGCRNTEGREAAWREIDLRGADWVVPAERFKSKHPHLVPLTDTLRERLEVLPYRDRHLFLFSARQSGARPFVNMNKPKAKLDLLSGVEGWVWHDFRRALRTGLSRLRVPSEIAERVIGHTDTRLGKTYNLYDFRQEKLEALMAWDKHVATITAAH
jgi:integrase